MRSSLTDKFRKGVHPFLLKMMPGRRTFSLKMLNSIPAVAGNKIFVMNHSNMHDAPVASEVIKEHFYILVGKQRLELLDKIFFRLNGVVYIDRKSKHSRRQGLEKMLGILKAGNSLLLYPEGTWNMTPSKPMLPLNWGVIELANRAGVPIIPLVAEYHPECCYTKFGEPIYIDADTDKKRGIIQLENVMATLKWDIWEQFPMEKRNESMKEGFERMIEQRIAEYSKFNLEYENSIIRRNAEV